MSKRRPSHIEIDYTLMVANCRLCGGVSKYRLLRGFRSQGRPFRWWDWRNGFIKAYHHKNWPKPN